MKVTERFTGRVESYRQHRPRYPDAVMNLLQRGCGLNSGSLIADIAAGTGLLAEKFLEHGFRVVAVEPNDEMRSACELLTERFPQLRCLAGTAEATKLSPSTFDLIAVGQAMHWFDLQRTRAEFKRILKPDGWCAVVYNERKMGGDAFHDGYEKLLRDFGTDYEIVQRQHLSAEKIASFFAPSPVKRAVFPNAQELTLEALTGRILSSSYMPKGDDPRHEGMLNAIDALFEKCQTNGYVHLEYDCSVSYGQL